jgi:hypothetical protein
VRWEREFELPKAGAVSGRIIELGVDVQGGQTCLVVKYFKPMDSSVILELEHAAHLAVDRISSQSSDHLHQRPALARSPQPAVSPDLDDALI